MNTNDILRDSEQQLARARFEHTTAKLDFLSEQVKETALAVSALSNKLDEVLKELDKVRKG